MRSVNGVQMRPSAPVRQTEAFYEKRYPTAYKVCHWDRAEGLKSAIGLRTAVLPARVAAYALRCWTKQRKGFGPLAVFRDLDAVAQFFTYNLHLLVPVVLEVCYAPSKEVALWRPGHIPGMSLLRTLVDLPKGTLLAERVLPLRVVSAWSTPQYEATGMPLEWADLSRLSY